MLFRSAPLFVGNRRHDLIFINCSMCYFLLRRPSPTRYYNLHPGVATTEAVQREIVAQLEAKRVEWILLWDVSPTGGPLEPRQARGATDLDAYLASRYESAARYGRWEIRHRSVKSCARPHSRVRGRNPKSRVSSP